MKRVRRLLWPPIGTSVERPSWAGSVPAPMTDDPWFWSLSALVAAWFRLLILGVAFVVASGVVGLLLGETVGRLVAVPWLVLATAAWLRVAFAMANYWRSREGWTWRSRFSLWHWRAIGRLILHPD